MTFVFPGTSCGIGNSAARLDFSDLRRFRKNHASIDDIMTTATPAMAIPTMAPVLMDGEDVFGEIVGYAGFVDVVAADGMEEDGPVPVGVGDDSGDEVEEAGALYVNLSVIQLSPHFAKLSTHLEILSICQHVTP